MFDYSIKKLEIEFNNGEAIVFAERLKSLTDPATGKIIVIERWRTPIDLENSDIVSQLSKGGVSLDPRTVDLIHEKIVPLLDVFRLDSKS